MNKPTDEDLERALLVGRGLINACSAPTREQLEDRCQGQVWDTDELGRDFIVKGFKAPFVVVKRKADGKVGSLLFQHHPRFYFGWEEYDGDKPLTSIRSGD